MSKTFNRQQAKLWAAEAKQKRRAETHRLNVQADMEMLGRFRKYFLLDCRMKADSRALVAAIDDHAEALTGDRRALHACDAGHIQPWWRRPVV